MCHVVNHFIRTTGEQSVTLLDLTDWIMLAGKLVEVVSKRATAFPVLELAYHSIYVQKSYEDCVILGGRGEELCHYKNIRLSGSGDLKQILTNVNRRAMRIIQSKAVKDTRHLSDIFRHMLPKKRTVSRTLSVSKFDAISPYVDCPAQVVEIHFSCEVDVRPGV